MDRRWRFARAEDKIARLSKRGLDMVAFWHACTPVLADAVRITWRRAATPSTRHQA
jgi:hypothetical protein